MLNNTGPAANEGFGFAAQFGQQLPNQLGAGQNVFVKHGGHNVLAGGRMAGMQSAAQQQAAQQAQAQQAQRQRMNEPPAAGPLQMQQQHFAGAQYGAPGQQQHQQQQQQPQQQQPQQQRNAGQQANPNVLLGAYGQPLGRGNMAAGNLVFPALANQQQNANVARPAGVNLGPQYGRNVRVVDSYLPQQQQQQQQQQQGLGGLMPGQRGGMGPLDAQARGGPAGGGGLLHGTAAQLNKGLVANGHSMAPGAAQPLGKDRMAAFQQQAPHPGQRLTGMLHQAKPADGLGPPGAAKLGGAANSNFLGDHEHVFDTSEFPALGMGADAGTSPAMSAMLGNVQHIFGAHDGSQYSGLGLPGSPAKAVGTRAALDHSDFPALGGHAAHGLAAMPAGSRAQGALMAPATDGALLEGKGGAGKPAELPQDAFGLMGLLSVIRMTDADVTTLALGLDLQTLGLNLNAPESLHRTFASPWSDESRPAAMDQHLPSCYLFAPQKLDAQSMGRFSELSVFFIFYAHAGEEKQLLAAESLCKRGWHFHKLHQVWCKPVPGKTQQVTLNGSTGEQGAFQVFDVPSWSIQDKEDLYVDWKQCEDPPRGAGQAAHASSTLPL